MTLEQMQNLQPGDLVRHKDHWSSYIVHRNFKSRVTAVRTVDLTNPIEWELVRPDGSIIHEEIKK